MTLPPHLEALKLDALRTSCEAWAIRARWPLGPGIDRAGPCPVCGGKDRFAIHTGKNTFNCRRCGISGAGVIDLVMKTQNVDFRRACEIVTGRSADEPVDPERAERLKADAEAEKARREKEAAEYRERAIRAGRAIWDRSKATEWRHRHPVFDYFAMRGIDCAAILANAPGALAALRFAPDLAWTEKRGREWVTITHADAMAAGIQFPDGSFAGVHRTWFDFTQPKGRLVLPDDDSGRPRATKKVLGTQRGCAIRLYTPKGARRIVGGEGIETTMSVFCHAFEPDTAYWALINLGNMHGKALRDGAGKQVHDQPDMEDSDGFLPPEWCDELVYLADAESEGSHLHDKLVRGLRRAMRLKPGRRGKIVPAPGPDLDFNDLAMQMADAEAIQ
ncbi:DUF7146 domain-containing protein [Pelagibacterium limicola]|uniref:DUF7146 domain-containing protein n=1 Tax=Pelagibacterium limicola TaxID=2791022 RepID=UPI0018AFB8A7|nr:primase-helicase zinc-binding domain-containing protein [Pelagibacterium limicola]